MGLLSRLFSTDLEAIRLPDFSRGSKAAELSAFMLRDAINRGSAGLDGPNRGRLATLFAGGYLFGFSESCIQGFGVFGEIESLALITVVHTKMFGGQVGWLLVQDALQMQGQAEFDRGQAAGADDFLRWLSDRSNTPRTLTDHLLENHEASSPNVSSSASPTRTVIEPRTAADESPTRSSVLWH
jgi:hypothetical protein